MKPKHQRLVLGLLALGAVAGAISAGLMSDEKEQA